MNDLQSDSEVSVTELVGGIITDAQKLIRQQLALFQQEVKEDLHKTKVAGQSMIWGSMMALVGGILLSFMLVELLSWAAPNLPRWASYGIVGTPIIGLGGAFYLAGIQKVKSLNLLPGQSVQALEETIQWKTNRK